MTGISACPPKGQHELTVEWDRLAEERRRQIASGDDLSFEHVIVPTTWGLFQDANRAVVLEIGCGTGEFTARLARVAEQVIAVEPSRSSMALAKRVCQTAQNVEFVGTSIEEAAKGFDERSVTAAVGVMTLMSAPDIRGIAKALASVLQSNARFVATITHPCFWPKYWEYENEPWFHYDVETFIEAPFVISTCCSEARTTHIHRPLDQYVNVFAEEGFRLDALAEPIPSPEVQALYPLPWRFPRFLGLRWVKVV